MTRPHLGLVIDDDPDAREAAADICRALGLQTEAVGSLEEALAALARRRFCFALVDRDLPYRPGGGPHKEVGQLALTRLHELDPDMALVIITAHSDVDYAVDAMMTGAAAFVAKPLGQLAKRLLLVLEQGCESRYQFGCPYLIPGGRKPTGVAPGREEATLYLEGTIIKRRLRVYVNETGECLLQECWFRALLPLALAAKRGEGVLVRKLSRSRDNPWKYVGKLKQALIEKGFPRDGIEPDGNGVYRLWLAPQNIQVNEPALRARFDRLLRDFSAQS